MVGEFDINRMTEQSLSTLANEQIISLVLKLKDENDKLKKSADESIAKAYDERLEKLEREINMDRQYHRKGTVEISGIPSCVPDEEVEGEVIKILKMAKAKVGPTKYPGPLDIQAAHRKGRKGVVIVKFVNRKFGESAVLNGRNLKNAVYSYTKKGDDDREEHIEVEGNSIYINQSLCPEFGFLHFAVRQAKRNGEIFAFNVKKGVMFIKRGPTSEWSVISHENDLRRNKLTVPVRRY